ncbi:MAG: hypothetical protein IJE10_10585 [Clostridia bacterium]|nr:hypothetical protein [Clostridia bacterium]
MRNVIPMFALTGKPTKEQIETEIAEFKKVGIGAVMIYPRSGCLVPYMSEEWFELIENAITVCEAADIKIWLYDEFNWPSGGCGGKVMAESAENWAKKIILTDDGLQIVADKRFPDLLSEHAVNTFIQLTHDKYYERFADKFGKVIVGMFTDEPCFCYQVERTEEIVYYTGLEADYNAKTGRDFFEDVTAYYQKHPFEGFMHTLFDLFAHRMKENYIGKIADWCKVHNILLTGHLLADTTVMQGTWDSGDTLSVLERIDVPGIDDISTKMGRDVFCAFAHIDAVKRKTGKQTMIELFALGPCDMSYNKKRRSLYIAAAYGIDTYFIAVAQLSMTGNYHKLRNYFNPESAMAPDYEKTALFCKEAEYAAELANKESTPDVYIRYPRENMLAYLDYGRKDAQKAEENTLETLRAIVNAQRTFAFTEADAENALDIRKDGVYYNNEKIDLQEFLSAMPKADVYVTEKGNLAENVFVKVYKDGTFIICDLEERTTNRKVEIHAFGKVFEKVMYPMQTVLSKELYEAETVETTPEFVMEFDKGVYRPLLWEPQTFTVKEPVKTRLAVRKYPAQLPLLLDGQEIKAELSCDLIGHGADALYAMTEEITLCKGTHTLECPAEKEERFYLPICVLLGDFESDGDVLNAKNPHKNKAYFYGNAKTQATLLVPESATKIGFETDTLYTKVYADGIFLGASAEDFAVVCLPEALRGKEVEFIFEQKTTMAPLFGSINTSYCDKMNETPEWNLGCGVTATPRGIGKIEFIK